MRRRLAVVLCLALAGAPAVGAVAAEKKADAASAEHYLDISNVALPIVWQGRVVNYVFTEVRLNLAARIDAMKLREKEPFFRDALVRAGHRTPFTRAWDFTHVDEAALVRALRPEVDRIAGPGAVVSITVMRQTPRQASGLPQRPGKA